MTNFIEKLKQVAAGRTAGTWLKKAWASIQQQPNGKHILDCFSGPADAEFIALAANCFDELVAVAAAAEAYRSCAPNIGNYRRLERAIEALRQKVEGGGG